MSENPSKRRLIPPLLQMRFPMAGWFMEFHLEERQQRLRQRLLLQALRAASRRLLERRMLQRRVRQLGRRLNATRLRLTPPSSSSS